MEQLLHYVFKHKLFPLRELKTSDGEPVEVIDPGGMFMAMIRTNVTTMSSSMWLESWMRKL